MSRLIQVNFGDGCDICCNSELYQWEQGVSLRITGVPTADNLRIDFSLDDVTGSATSTLCSFDDGAVCTFVPALILEKSSVQSKTYKAYANIYYTEDNDKKRKKVIFEIKARPKPESYISEPDPDYEEQLFERVRSEIEKVVEDVGVVIDIPIDSGEGVNAFQQSLNREVFTVSNEDINDCPDVVRDKLGKIVSGAMGDYSSEFGGSAQAKGKRSKASGSNTVALGGYSDAGGNETFAKGANTTSRGLLTSALGDNSTAEGNMSKSIGDDSHAQNTRTKAKGCASTSMGIDTEAEGDASTVGGRNSRTEGDSAFSHGLHCEAIGSYSFATGAFAKALAELSSAFGIGTKAVNYCEQVIGRYNKPTGSAFAIGNGESDEERSNCFYVDFNGNVWFSGGLYMGGNHIGDAVNLTQVINELTAHQKQLDDEIANIKKHIGIS